MNSSYYKYCIVPQCTSTIIKTPNKLFIYVPNNQQIRKKWLTLARKKDAHSLSSKSRMYFCEDHFDLPNDMLNYTQYRIMGKVAQVRMKPDCIPSKFEFRKRTCSMKEQEETQSSSHYNTPHTFSDPEDACNIEPEVMLITGPLPENDPLNVKPDKCCLCAEITDHVDTYKPYLENQKMTLTLNGINVEMDFNKDRQRVCFNCDNKLLDIFNFVQQVRIANAILNARNDREETLNVKTECESPMLDDNDEIEDIKEEIVDDITIDETAFVKEVFVHKKKKSDKKQHTALKTAKVKDETCDDSDRTMDIKEATEIDDVNTKIYETGYSVNRYTGSDVNAKTRKISLINKKL